jgi:uncharacterized protein
MYDFVIAVAVIIILLLLYYIHNFNYDLKLSYALIEVNELMTSMDISHDIKHVLRVLHHTQLAIDSFEETNILRERHQLIIILAALLHEVDDKKYFNTTNYSNARKIINKYYPALTNDVIECIQLVSASENGNDINPNIPLWKYIPRFGDRLEAMGKNGIDRCIEYSKYKGAPMRISTTPNAKNIDDVQRYATIERFEQYWKLGKKSESTIDHFYDKLLHLRMETGIPYIDDLMEKEHYVMIDWLINQYESN